MQVKCGVVGVGYLGAHHARIYSEMEDVNLVGVYDANTVRAKEIATQYRCQVFQNAEDLACQCQALSVVTPTVTHAQVAVPLLKLGCHLLVEKPLCTSLAEAEKLIHTAADCQRYLQVGHIEHFNPVAQFLEQHVREPRYITSDRLAPFNIRGTDVGVVLDLMIHDLSIILQLVNSPVESVDAVGVSVLSPREDIANARLHFKNGCIANLNASRISAKKVREIRIFQPNKYLSLDFMNQQGHLLYKEGLEVKREEIPLNHAEPLRIELESFVRCVREAHRPKIDGSVGRSTLALALEITDKIWKNR